MLSRMTLFFALAAACLLFRTFSTFALAEPVNPATGMSKGEIDRQFSRAMDLDKQGKKAEAAALYESILPAAEKIFGRNSQNVAVILNNLGVLYRDMRLYAKAEPLFNRSIQTTEANVGKNHPEVATTLINLAKMYQNMGEYAKAEPIYQRALQIREVKLGEGDLQVANSLNLLGRLYMDMVQYAKAEPVYQRALRILEVKLGKEHPSVANYLNNLAYLYRDMGLYAKAEPLYQRSLQIREALGKDHPDVAESLNNMADLYLYLGQHVKAEPLFLRSVQIIEAKLGKDHANLVFPLNNLGNLYGEMGQYAKAEPLFLRSLQVSEAKYGKDDHRVAIVLNGLANLYRSMGQNTKAGPLFVRSLQIRRDKLGKDHPDVATALHNLADLYRHMGEYAKAESLFLHSLQIYEAALGKDHPRVAGSLERLAAVYHEMGQYAKAEPLHLRSLHIREAKLGKEHPGVAESLNGLAWSSARQKEWTKAVDHVMNARKVAANHVAAVLPSLSEQEQLSMLRATFVGQFHDALSLGWSARKEASSASAEWLLNGKAVAHQSLAEQQILARDAKDPKAKQLVEDLKQTRGRLAALINRSPNPGLEKEYQTEMQALRSREQDLAQKLARAVGRPHRSDTWVKLSALQAKLSTKTAFVDVARFRVFDFENNKRKGPRYVAWITSPAPGEAGVQLIDLGDADAIDKLVEQTRTTLLDSAKTLVKIGEVEASAALQKPLQALSAKVLHPLLPALEKYEEWIVCPDGALWLTPWNALLLPDGKFAVEKYLIRHVVSGRDLMLNLPEAKAGPSYIFADPDFDLSPSKVTAASGLRGIGGPLGNLIGQSLRGAIGARKYIFEFRAGEVLIRDEEFKGAVSGKGTWKLKENALTIQTSISLFQGTIEGNEIRGQRSKRNDDGTTTRDTFRIELPQGDRQETRTTGLALAMLPKVPRLPGTAAEAEAVRPKIQQWLGQAPKLFLEGQAGEAAVKAVKNPRVLVLATHGYFLPTQEVESKDGAPLDLGEGKRAVLFDKKGQPIENPLLRCGLLLAGSNKRAEAKPGEDDGILTGLEIVGMNLNGCELVVLSACETGLGDVRNGEGVAGLRQAFQLAGAKAVLASLWQVPDRETALLMNTFYGEIAKGRGQAGALRAAQLQRIAARRDAFGAAHPFFWSAFALTSRGTD
jgi:tetratricopeptide (TPR) repeat protein